jgi:hypothetical protein
MVYKSLRSGIDRTNLFDIPSYTKLIAMVKGVNDKPWIRPCLAVLAATGGRVSEILYLKRGNIKFINYHGQDIPHDKLSLSEVATIQFNLSTEKNRKAKFRIVPLIKNQLFLDLVEIIVDYCKNFKYDDTLLFPYTRGAVWYSIKRNLGKDFGCHWVRHVNCTNDSRAGVSPAIQKAKYGHTDLRAQSAYQHLNFVDIINEQTKAFGKPTEKEKVYTIINEHAEARKEYNEERDFKSEPVSEERAALQEMRAHPKPDPPKTPEDIQMEKIVKAIEELPKEEGTFIKEPPVPAILPIDDPTFIKEVRIYPEPKFVGPQLPDPQPLPPFDTVKEEGKKFFKSGMIINDKIIIINASKHKTEDLKKAYNPNKVIPVHVPDPKYAVQTAALLKYQEIQRQKKQAQKEKEDSTEFLQVV